MVVTAETSQLPCKKQVRALVLGPPGSISKGTARARADDPEVPGSRGPGTRDVLVEGGSSIEHRTAPVRVRARVRVRIPVRVRARAPEREVLSEEG